MNRTVEAVRKILKRYELKKEEVIICYEAGPTGFVLARRLIKLGFECVVIAPSLIPSKSGDKKKTDRRDARKLADFLRSGHLTPVHIPDLDDEVIRDVCRGRTGAAQGLARTRKL
ncbi:IS110 family transposase [Pontiella agarivorans]|uniref:Transposase n=1 Tax=Pontiella agarivorans TaxID=3038953 RepID=A0ABU5MXD4_9BACT|nr:transposase [Pontiella agarivorans]MDZ8118817.1 transposase [Pontiella agarivorans]